MVNIKRSLLSTLIALSLVACNSDSSIDEPKISTDSEQNSQQQVDDQNNQEQVTDPQENPPEQNVETPVEELPVQTEVPVSNPPPAGQQKSLNTFIFGHSLIVHAWGDLASDETTVPYWVNAFAESVGHSYGANGQYGFLPQHANLSPSGNLVEGYGPYPQWGFGDASWDADSGDNFASQSFDSILMTPANFVQYQSADSTYDGDNPTQTSPLLASVDIIEWVSQQQPGIKVYIYENWPDMASFVSDGAFNPTDAQLTNYYNYTLDDNPGGFHHWWLDYHDMVVEQLPAYQVKMIPVGYIMMDLLQHSVLSGIPALDLYEDNAPHGRPSLYFLAAMITYTAMYQEMVPQNFTVPSSIHSLIRDNFDQLRQDIYQQLNQFTFANGDSRIW